jgi:hypothetical protein
MTGAAAGAAAAAAAARQLDLTLEAFRLADATAPNRAKPLESMGLVPSRAVTRLSEAGVILPAPNGNGVYLSEAAFVVYKRANAARAAWIAMAAGVVMLLAALAGFLLVARPAGH